VTRVVGERQSLSIGFAEGRIQGTRVELTRIRLDGDTQGRIGLDETVIAEYTALMAEGAQFPPVRIWFDGQHYWLADGFHRVESARRAALREIAADIHSGTLKDAQWDSFGANAANGLRRTRADLQLVMARALEHQRATGLSTNHLAKHIGIPESTLRRWKQRSSSHGGEDEHQVCVAARKGVTYRIDTKNIGARGSTRRPLRSGHPLATDLEAMRSVTVCPETRRILAILEKWVFGLADYRATVLALDRVYKG
jgi:hypothetical protein